LWWCSRGCVQADFTGGGYELDMPVTVMRPLRTVVTGGLGEEAGIACLRPGERAGAGMVTPLRPVGVGTPVRGCHCPVAKRPARLASGL
jgi:hypothetical protein